MHEQLKQILNYHEFDSSLATAGQPTEQQFKLVREAGFEVIINLARTDSPGALANEADIVTASGMQYIHIPVDFKQPETSNLEEFFTAMNEYRGKNRFIHCACNWRVSAFMYLYRTKKMGLQKKQAEDEMFSIWTPDPVWSDFIRMAEDVVIPDTDCC